jgi:hypothetical protein
MTTISYEDQMRADTIVELARGLVRLAVDMLELHGPDPQNHAILSASFKMALEDIGKVYPFVPLTVAVMVKEDAAKSKH